MDIDVSQTAADSALQHLVVVVVSVAQGLLVALQSFLEDTEAEVGVAHAETNLAVELQADGGTLHVQAGLTVGHRFLEVAQLLVAARQVQVTLCQVVWVLHFPGGVDLSESVLQRERGRPWRTSRFMVITFKKILTKKRNDILLQRHEALLLRVTAA